MSGHENGATWYTVAEAARVLGVSARTVQRRIDKGEYESRKEQHNRMVLIPNSDIDRDIDQDAVATLKQRIKELEAELEEVKKKHQEDVNYYRQRLDAKDEELAEASHRHDTVVMQMSRLLEYHQQPFWRRLFSRKALPPPADEAIMDMQPGDDKSKI